MTVVCFDLDGTLVQLARAYDEILTEVFEAEFSVSTPALVDTYDEAFFAAFGTLTADPYGAGMRAVLDAAPGDAADTTTEALVARLQQVEYDAGTVEDAARRSLSRLESDNTLVVVTNGTPDWQRGKLAHHGLAEQFDLVVTSYEAGAHKPDSAIFEVVRERFPNEEFVMVGDDYEADVEGARAAGFVPIHYEDDGPGFWQTLDALT